MEVKNSSEPTLWIELGESSLIIDENQKDVILRVNAVVCNRSLGRPSIEMGTLIGMAKSLGLKSITPLPDSSLDLIFKDASL